VWDRIETQHLKHAFKPKHAAFNKYFYRAMRKHGKEAFAWKIVCNAGVGVSDELLNRLEIAYIAAYESFGPKGYNLTSGGGSGRQLSAATKKKLSDSIREWNKNREDRSMREENKQKMSLLFKGVPKSAEQRQKQSVSMKRRFQESGGTPCQVRQKISAGVSAWVAKRRAAGLPVGGGGHPGVPKTQQARERMSAANKAYFAKQRAAGLPHGRKASKAIRARRGDGVWMRYDSLKHAAKESGISRHLIRKQCQGRASTTNAWLFQFA